jgi:ATP-binding cassette subfamily C (CFTR/MRP) protein 1
MVSPVIAFAIYIAIANRDNTILDFSRLFTSLSLLILLSQPLFDLFGGVIDFKSAVGCFDRIERFLLADSRVDHRAILPGLLAPVEGLSMSTSSRSLEAHDKASVGAELANRNAVSLTQVAPFAVSVQNGTFGWSKDGEAILHGINFNIRLAQLTLLVGPVASGKSTLLKALLGETPCSKGFVQVMTPKIAWCEQTPWLIVSQTPYVRHLTG